MRNCERSVSIYFVIFILHRLFLLLKNCCISKFISQFNNLIQSVRTTVRKFSSVHYMSSKFSVLLFCLFSFASVWMFYTLYHKSNLVFVWTTQFHMIVTSAKGRLISTGNCCTFRSFNSCFHGALMSVPIKHFNRYNDEISHLHRAVLVLCLCKSKLGPGRGEWVKTLYFFKYCLLQLWFGKWFRKWFTTSLTRAALFKRTSTQSPQHDSFVWFVFHW